MPTYNFFLAPRTPLGSEVLADHALLHVHEGHIPLVEARQERPIAAELYLSPAARAVVAHNASGENIVVTSAIAVEIGWGLEGHHAESGRSRRMGLWKTGVVQEAEFPACQF